MRLALSFSVCVVVVGCNGATAASGDGTSPNPGADGGAIADGNSTADGGPVPDAFVSATVAAGAGGACNVSSSASVVTLGAALGGGSKPSTVANGGESSGAPVNVACTVVLDNGGFDVSLSAEDLGSNGGSVTIQSVGMGSVTLSGGGGTVSADFNGPAVGHYTESDCTLSYTYDGGPLPASAGMPVAPGRIWAHVSCPRAELVGQTGVTCDAEADFLFEDCTGS
jgi:hypothetical protein